MPKAKQPKPMTVLFAMTMSRGQILASEQIGDVRLNLDGSLDMTVSRSLVQVHAANIANELRRRLSSNGGKVKIVA